MFERNPVRSGKIERRNQAFARRLGKKGEENMKYAIVIFFLISSIYIMFLLLDVYKVLIR